MHTAHRIVATAVVSAWSAGATACPFCDVVGRPLAERRDAAGVVAVGEAAGAARDLRKDAPYLAYADLDFEVPVGILGDNYDRYYVRMREMDESVYMIRQLMDMIPAGPICVDDPRCTLPPKSLVYGEIESLINHFKLITDGPVVPAGEVTRLSCSIGWAPPARRAAAAPSTTCRAAARALS